MKWDWSWSIRLHYHKLNQVVVPVIAAVPDGVSLLQQINKASSTWHAATDLANVFFSSSSGRSARSSLHSHGINTVYTYSLVPWPLTLPSVICHNIVWSDLDYSIGHYIGSWHCWHCVNQTEWLWNGKYVEGLGLAHILQKVREEPYEYLGTWHISNICRNPVI